MKEKILVIGGPTGVGKSKIAFDTAMRISGEIISADSMQFYREINIGTDKATAEMRKALPHHFIDVLSINQDFDVSEFVKKAVDISFSILGRKRIPVVTGGSGLYLRCLIDGIFPSPVAKESRKYEIREVLKKETPAKLYNLLKRADPESAGKIHSNDTRRIIRALEVFLLTGKPISYWHSQKPESSLRDAGTPVVFVLTRKRELLYSRIEDRIDRMFEEGWIDEVQQLKSGGYGDFLRYKAPIGYVEILEYLDGACNFSELKKKIKINTRNLAKKQLTWFRKHGGVWIEVETDDKAVEKIISVVSKAEGIELDS